MKTYDLIPPRVNDLARITVDASYRIHKALGPGLLESVYEACLAHELSANGIDFDRQVVLPVIYEGAELNVFLRMDLWLEKQLVVELKSVEQILPVHTAQVLTYLRITGNRLGLLINFNVAMFKDGVQRIAL